MKTVVEIVQYLRETAGADPRNRLDTLCRELDIWRQEKTDPREDTITMRSAPPPEPEPVPAAEPEEGDEE